MSGQANAKEQVARLLALVPYLLSRGEVRVADAAEHFNVSPAQLRKDLRVLFMVGLPGGMPDDLIDVDLDAFEGEGVIRVGNADYLSRPVRFAPAEAAALTVALGAIVDAVDEVGQEVIERTLDKLREVVAAADALPHLHVDPSDLAASDVERTLAEAVRAQRQVRISYHAASNDEVTERVVDPRGLAHVDGLRYLDAYCHTARAERVFRVDRILDVTQLDTPVADPSARPRDLTRDWFTPGSGTSVTLLLSAGAAWVPEYYPVKAERRHDDGRVEVDLEADNGSWVMRLLMRLTPEVEVLAPASLATEHRARLRSALDQYDTSVTS
ncbi:MAG: helix-turn-helix transcriptional regulator [Nocardioides sp.]|uniref:helix-turn-helix transcriptional regulator n=1 Tax=Nocardioides sp. TaxID=35761 RepID=UPI003EFF20EF